MSAQRYRKLPVEVEAMEFNGLNYKEIVAFTFGKAHQQGRNHHLVIVTLEGIMEVSPGDFVIKGIQGECYPCKPDIFWRTYERVE